MRIENYIPEGRENAISREALGNIVGDDRVARKMIEDARCNVVIINLQDGNGYYLPTSNEREDVERWYRATLKRAKKILRGLRAARKWLKEHPDSQMKWEV